MDKVVEPKVALSIEIIGGIGNSLDFRSELNPEYIDEVTTILIEMIEKYPQFGHLFIHKIIKRVEKFLDNNRKDLS